ncbi:hypothetical protein LXA43DRAFT_1091103 [Ganoderma leucocontextum]|nr:hypothetical protein LXA43DRAFT_1091103 [Ganoderma leucocontextum]
MEALHIKLDENDCGDGDNTGNDWPPTPTHLNDLLGPLLIFSQREAPQPLACPTLAVVASFRDYCLHLRELTLLHFDLDTDAPGEPKPYYTYRPGRAEGSGFKSGRGDRLKRMSFAAPARLHLFG